MSILGGFLLKILKSAPISKEEAGQMSIIVRRPYDYKVKVGSRYGQRRTKKEPFSYERRRDDGRRKKETLVEVVIST